MSLASSCSACFGSPSWRLSSIHSPKKGEGWMIAEHPASTKKMSWANARCVRGIRAVAGRGVRVEKSHWARDVPKLLKAKNLDCRWCPSRWAGKQRPKCSCGTLSSLQLRKGSGDSFPKCRCNEKDCQKRLFAPFVSTHGPDALSLQTQSSLLLLLLLLFASTSSVYPS